MPLEKAKKAIDDLNAELQSIPQETGPLESLLEKTKDEIEDATPEAIKDLFETLQREAEEFEVEHPRVKAAINHVIHTLSGLGI